MKKETVTKRMERKMWILIDVIKPNMWHNGNGNEGVQAKIFQKDQ